GAPPEGGAGGGGRGGGGPRPRGRGGPRQTPSLHGPTPAASHRPRRAPYLPGSKMNGSSLPNCSALPLARSLSLRACDRWIASRIMAGVAEVGAGFLTGAVGEGSTGFAAVADVV